MRTKDSLKDLETIYCDFCKDKKIKILEKEFEHKLLKNAHKKNKQNR